MVETPCNRSEWQDAADMAYGALVLDSARQYGLVVGGPGVNVERCEELLRRAKQLGIVPNEKRGVELVLRGAL